MSSKHFSQLVNTVVAGGSRYHSNNFQTTLKRNLLSAGAKVWLAKAIGLCCIPSSDEWERTAPIPYGDASQARSKVDVSVLLAFSKCGCPCLSPLPRLAFAQKQIERRQDAGQIQNELCMIVKSFSGKTSLGMLNNALWVWDGQILLGYLSLGNLKVRMSNIQFSKLLPNL